jgi:hypothetical protein
VLSVASTRSAVQVQRAGITLTSSPAAWTPNHARAALAQTPHTTAVGVDQHDPRRLQRLHRQQPIAPGKRGLRRVRRRDEQSNEHRHAEASEPTVSPQQPQSIPFKTSRSRTGNGYHYRKLRHRPPPERAVASGLQATARRTLRCESRARPVVLDQGGGHPKRPQKRLAAERVPSAPSSYRFVALRSCAGRLERKAAMTPAKRGRTRLEPSILLGLGRCSPGRVRLGQPYYSVGLLTLNRRREAGGDWDLPAGMPNRGLAPGGSVEL